MRILIVEDEKDVGAFPQEVPQEEHYDSYH
jgi:DNA-binding response OmpR family regulator